MDRAQCLEAYSLFRPAALPKNVPYTFLRLINWCRPYNLESMGNFIEMFVECYHTNAVITSDDSIQHAISC